MRKGAEGVVRCPGIEIRRSRGTSHPLLLSVGNTLHLTQDSYNYIAWGSFDGDRDLVFRPMYSPDLFQKSTPHERRLFAEDSPCSQCLPRRWFHYSPSVTATHPYIWIASSEKPPPTHPFRLLYSLLGMEPLSAVSQTTRRGRRGARRRHIGHIGREGDSSWYPVDLLEQDG